MKSAEETLAKMNLVVNDENFDSRSESVNIVLCMLLQRVI